MFNMVMHPGKFVTAVALLLSASAAPVSAQVGPAWIDRGYFNFNIGFETTSGVLTDSASFFLYDEIGTKSTEQNADSGALIDFSAGSRVWRNVSVGIGYHRDATGSEASGSALVPHPLLFGRNRAAAFATSDLTRTEQAFHIQLGYMLPINDDVSVHLTVGPSFFRLKQDVIGDVSFVEQSPFTSVTANPVIAERTDSVTGVNLGVDVAYQVWESDAYDLGAGAFLRYAGASARIDLLENNVDTDVGGLQFGVGLRVRF